MNVSTVQKIKLRTEVKKNVHNIEKRIRYLQRELVRASFKGEEKEGLCRKLLRLIKQERQKKLKILQAIQ